MILYVLVFIFSGITLLSAAPAAEESTAARALKPKYSQNITLLTSSHRFIKRSQAPDYWALSPYYVGQQTDSACSLAAATMVVNAARAKSKMKANEELASQNGLLKRLADDHYAKAVGVGGAGILLEQMKSILEKSLAAYGVDKFTVELIRTPENSKSVKAELHRRLIENEKSARNFIVANFIQGVFTGDEMVGHYAVVGAYDQKTARVLIMDPDRQWYEPYWVSESLFLKGMTTTDEIANHGRGYLWVSLPKQ